MIFFRESGNNNNYRFVEEGIFLKWCFRHGSQSRLVRAEYYIVICASSRESILIRVGLAARNGMYFKYFENCLPRKLRIMAILGI